MFLIVDKNENDVAPEVVKQLKKHYSNVIIANLPHRKHGSVTVTSGDINIALNDGSVLAIERKTPHDFLQSIASGHLFDQVEVMAQNSKYSAVVVTGYFTYTNRSDMACIDGEETQWRGASVRGAIRILQYSGCPVEFCPPNRYAQVISEIYTTVNTTDKRQSVKKQRIITFPPVDYRVELLAQFPGVGLKLADSAMKFARKMDGEADYIDSDGIRYEFKDDYSTLASAIHWLTIMSGISKKERPAGWGPNKLLTFRKTLGLASDEYIKIEREEDIDVTEASNDNNKKRKARRT